MGGKGNGQGNKESLQVLLEMYDLLISLKPQQSNFQRFSDVVNSVGEFQSARQILVS